MCAFDKEILEKGITKIFDVAFWGLFRIKPILFEDCWCKWNTFNITAPYSLWHFITIDRSQFNYSPLFLTVKHITDCNYSTYCAFIKCTIGTYPYKVAYSKVFCFNHISYFCILNDRISILAQVSLCRARV